MRAYIGKVQVSSAYQLFRNLGTSGRRRVVVLMLSGFVALQYPATARLVGLAV